MNPPSSHDSEQTLVDAEHPWPGLASFREQDEHFFKGREPDIDSLHNLVTRERLTVLFGVSGLGKSSLLQAGLFPLLRQDTMLPVFIRLDFGDAAAGVVEQVFATIARQVQEKAIEAPVRWETETLWEYFHRKDAEFWDTRNRLVIPVLCFDQLEEVFTLGREAQTRVPELKQLLTELADLVEGRCPDSVKVRLDANPNEARNFSFSRHPYKLIFSLREDYLADLEGVRGLMPSIIHNRMRLRPMNGEQALRVADQTHGRLMEHSVAETIVRLIAGKQGEEGLGLKALRIEPALLSLVCRELNERRIEVNASQIDAQAVETNREQILEKFYERSLADHSPELRSFIEDKLITLSGFRNSEAYENALGSPGISAEALDQLVQCRVLRLEERDGVKRIELIHDVLTGVVRKSRDQRLVLEKQRQAEQERREAEQREQAAREALRRSKRWALSFLVLTGIAVLSAAWGWWSWWDAQQARGKAQHALAVSDFREAEQHYQNNNLPDALVHLAHAVRLEPQWMSSRTWLVNLLQQRKWFLPVAIFSHKEAVSSAAFSPDGTRVVTVSDEKSAQLWDARTGKPLGDPMRHGNKLRSAQFSPDGRQVVTASDDNTAQLWDAQTAKPSGEPLRHGDWVISARFSPDGTRLVTASADNTARLWDVRTGKPRGEPLAQQGPVTSAEFNFDGTLVVTASNDNTARLWDAQTGKPLGKLLTHGSLINFAQFSPDGRQVVTATADNTARLWDVQTGKPMGEPLKHQGGINSVEFNPDGTRVVTASDDNTARLWNTQTGKPLGELLTHKSVVNSARFSPDGRRVVTASDDNTARLWDAQTGEPLGEALAHGSSVKSAGFSHDGTLVLTASKDNTARLWDVRISKPTSGEPLTHESGVNSAEFSLDGRQVLTASGDKTVRLWDAQSGKPIGKPLTHKEGVKSAHFSPDGTRVVSASADKTAQLWDVQTGKPLGKPLAHEDEVWTAQFSPDGTRVVTTSDDNMAKLWDAQTGTSQGDPLRHGGHVWTAQFSPDGMQVVTASGDKTAQLWNVKTGKPLGKPLTHKDLVTSALFSPDGTRIMTTSFDNTAQLWDTQTGKPLGAPLRHGDWVICAQFSPDGNRVVTASADNTARLWDAQTGKPFGEPLVHENSVNFVRFSPDGTRVVTASKDNTARLWSGAGKSLGEPLVHTDSVNSAQFSPDGTRVVTASRDNTARLWDVSPAASGDWALLAKLTEAVAGSKLSELGAIEPLENQIGQLNDLRKITANAPLGEPTAESFIRWFLSDPWTRTVSPLFSLTVPEYIQQQIAAGRRDEMEQAFPGHPLLRPAPVPKPNESSKH